MSLASCIPKFEVASARPARIISIWSFRWRLSLSLLFKMAAITTAMLLGENHNKLLHSGPNIYWLAPIWTPFVVLSPRSMGWLLLIVYWEYTGISKMAASAQLEVVSRNRKYTCSSHSCTFQMPAYYFLQELFFSSHLEPRWPSKANQVKVVCKSH